MIESDSSSVQEKLATLNRRYRDGLPMRLAQIEEAARQCLENQVEDIETLHRLLHSLAGSAGVYGMPELGQEARRIELVLKRLTQGGGGQAAIASALQEEIASFAARWSAPYL